MPRATLSKNYFGFSKGKITEASGLTFPENSLSAAMNVDLGFDGSVRRRKGIDFETGASQETTATDPDTVMVQTWVWEGANAYGAENILVTRTGYDVVGTDLDSNTVTEGAELFSFSLSVFAVTGAAKKAPISLAFVKGKIYWAGRYLTPGYYDRVQLVEYLDPFIRDLEGPLSTTDASSRPSSLSDNHRYNLINQGWPKDQIRTDHPTFGSTLDYAWEEFYDKVGKYPALSDVYTGHSSGTYNASSVRTSVASSGPAPKGHYLLPLFDQDRTAISGLSISETVRETNERFSCVASFQGRLIYGTVNDEGYEDTIYISQTIETARNAGRFYSVNDPTAEDINSPLDTDGGTIKIDGLGRVKEIHSMADAFVVFSDRGVWVVKAADDNVFSVNNYRVIKVSKTGISSSQSVVEYENAVFFWGTDGIYAVTPNQQLSYDASNLTETTIQSFYISLPDTSKSYATGVADPTARKIYWLYNDFNTSDAGFNQNFNKVLVFDARLGAFYDYEFARDDDDTGPFVCAAIYKSNSSTSTIQDDVYIGSDQVVIGSDPVYIEEQVTSALDAASRIKFLSIELGASSFDTAWAELKSNDFLDWYSRDLTGINYSSYIETGYDTMSDPMREKQLDYVFTYFNRTENSFVDNGSGGVEFDRPSSCLMRTKWDWTTLDSTNQWSASQQVYRFRRPFISGGIGDDFDYGYDVIETKNKVRGSGKALVMRFESEEGKDFQLLGWAVQASAGSMV